MECPQCQFVNPPEAARCSKCDTPLELGDATLTDATPPSSQDNQTMDVPAGWSAPVVVSAAGTVAAATSLQAGVVLGNRYEIPRG